jgi:hypothetical protein
MAAVTWSRLWEGFLWAVGHAALSTFCGRNSQRERTRSGVAITSSPAWSNGRQREEPVMSDRLDTLARAVAEPTTRRTALMGLGALALGSLGLRRVGQEAEAKNNNNNDCNQCKQQCKRNNRKSGKKHPKNCNNKCRNKC